MLNGFALTKVGRNTVSLADVVDGTGDGDVIVRQGTLNIEHGSVLDGAGTVRVLHGANLALNDTNSSLGYSVPTSPVSITKNIVLNGSDLTNTNGSRSLPQGISTSGDFRVYNNDAAATVTLGNIVQPVRGAGGQFGTAGSVVLTTINGAALPSGRLGDAAFSASPREITASPRSSAAVCTSIRCLKALPPIPNRRVSSAGADGKIRMASSERVNAPF